MHRRHQLRNLPTEVLRTIVAIVDGGSFTKAASILGLTQPAITAQVQRLTSILGDDIFDKGATGLALTPWGAVVLDHARRLLAINDQIIALSAGVEIPDLPRVGLSVAYAKRFLQIFSTGPAADRVALVCESSDEIAKRLAEGRLDAACVFEPAPDSRPIARWTQPLEWCRGPGLVLVPDQPVPLVAWPGYIIDRIGIGALEDAGLSYSLRLASADFSARVAATALGFGVKAGLKEFRDERLHVVSNRSLPPLRSVVAGFCIRPGFKEEKIAPVIETILSMTAGLNQQREPASRLAS